MRGKLSQYHTTFLLLLGWALVAGLVAANRVSYAGSDPNVTLLASQALLEQGTLELDAYRETDGSLLTTHTVLEKEGRLLPYYPPGSSVFSLPFVAAARVVGWNMALEHDNFALQQLLAALLAATIFALLFLTGDCFLPPLPAFTIALFSTLGSSLVSSVGTALWSFDFSLLFSTAALLLLARQASGRANTVHPLLLGFLLFATYFSRPAAAAFIVSVFGYLLWQQRRALLPAAFTALLLLLGFVVFSWGVYGSWLPPYYLAERWFEASRVSEGLYGLFLSPSRGLFVFSPFFALVLLGAVARWRTLRAYPLAWLALAWFLLHVLMVAVTHMWWGGWAYGSRLLADVLPALVLLSFLLWRDLRQGLGVRVRYLVIAAFFLLAGWSMYVNSYQGLFNLQTRRWNGELSPDTSLRTTYLFDWRFPQFLASQEALCRREASYLRGLMADHGDVLPLRHYNWGAALEPDADGVVNIDAVDLEPSPPAAREATGAYRAYLPLVASPSNQALFMGWSHAVGGARWSECAPAAVVLRLGQLASTRYALQIEAGSNSLPEIPVAINGEPIGLLRFGDTPAAPVSQTLSFESSLLRDNALNEITFDTRGARAAGGEDARLLGLQLVTLRLLPLPG